MHPPASSQPAPDQAIVNSLLRAGLLSAGQGATYAQLTGGVSSDIWRVTTPDREFCVKRALPKLKVAAEWFAPVERNGFEVAWFQIAGRCVPGSAPQVIAHDATAMLFAMQYLDPDTHKLWKSELRDGHADPAQAAEVGRRLGRIHAATAGDKAVAAQFPRTDIFHSIRLEPYLEATALRHPDLKARLFALSRLTAETQLVMIHGDVSPKNILQGPNGPVFLDAECACIGDPAFDLAFCLNHLLLKCLWLPGARDRFFACFAAMTDAYLAEITWESVDGFEQRAAHLLPGLFLARVDGKSPAEYVTDEDDKNRIRHCARTLLAAPAARLSRVAVAWKEELSK